MFSRLFFSKVTPIIRLGLQKSLEPEDFFQIPERLSAHTKTVDEDQVRWNGNGSQMVHSLYWQARRHWYLAVFLLFLNACLNLATPVLIHEFVRSLEQARENPWDTFLLGLVMGLCALFSGLSIQHYFHKILNLYQILTNAVNRKIYRHALRLKKSEKDQLQVGDIVNHMSSDSDSVANLGQAIGDGLYLMFVLTGFVGLIFYYMGATAWVALVALGLLFPIVTRAGKKFSGLDELLMKKRDERVTLMSQVLSSIRVIKSFVWEKSITKEVQVLRGQELGYRARLARSEMAATMIFIAVGTLVLFLVLGAHVLRGFALDAALVFTMVSLFRLIEEPFGMFSRVISGFANARVSGERLVHFMKKKEVSDFPSEDVPGFAYRLQNLNVNLGSSHVLKNVTFDVQRGENLAIIGAVGSGKSTLLLSLAGENDCTGSLKKGVQAKALVPQDAFIINSSLRENLTFGQKEISQIEIDQALYACGLDQDLALWSGGLETEIGEKGVNLSGGQKQRLSLARTLLQKPDVVLLDDPLSAVDPKTEALLMERLILGAWKNVTRVTSTHRLEHLPNFDRILFLENGMVKALGTFDELMKVPDFLVFISQQHQVQQMDSKEVAPVNAHTQEAMSAENLAVATATGEAPPTASQDRITIDEDREYGAVKGSVYWEYILSLAGSNLKHRPWILSFLMGSALLATSLPLVQKLWLARMTDAGKEFFLTPGWAILGYGILGVLTLAGILASDLFWLQRGLQAGKDLHDQMLTSILGAQTRFFDSNPVGRILQRFSRDLESIDIELQWCFENSLKSFMQVFVNLVLIILVVPLVMLVLVPVSWIYYRYQKHYRMSAREVKRLDSLSRSPRYAHFKETVSGLVVLRSLGKEEWFYSQFAERLDYNQRMFYGHYMINRWFSSRIPLVGSLVAIGTSSFLTFAVYQNQIQPGLAGMVAVSSLGFWGLLNWGIRIWADVEARMTSVERIKTFIRAPQEKQIPNVSEIENLPLWPEKGEIEFRNLVIRYAPQWPQVLKGLSFQVPAGSKVGIIGRTGSGKSTVFQSLSRFVEAESGQILIDGVDIKNVPLHRLRRAIAIIPQDPQLFLGTLRSNLDRFEQCTEEQIWDVLEKVRLKELIQALPKKLNEAVVENGMNFSQGQRQLICLARALLAQARIVILDEATASVDVQTDAAVQKVVRESCKGLTMLIIAHRLGTVKDCHQILELSEGRLKRRLIPKSGNQVPPESKPFSQAESVEHGVK